MGRCSMDRKIMLAMSEVSIAMAIVMSATVRRYRA